jgi:hypothetical protein
MRTYGGVEVELEAFLTSALDGDEWSASRLGRFTLRKRAPSTHWIGWVGPGAGNEEENICPCRKSNPDRPVRSLVTAIVTKLRATACVQIS